MKRSIIVTLVASAVVACLAFAGASTASATETVLCKKEQTPCLAENIYPVGSTITAEATAEADQLKITTDEPSFQCTSRIKATVGSGTELSITEWALGLSEPCITYGGTHCYENKATGLPYKANVSGGSISVQSYASFYFDCDIFHIIHVQCTYSVWTSLGGLGNKTAAASKQEMEQSGTNCWGEEPYFNVTFRLENPIYKSTRPTAATTVKANHITATGATLAGTVNPDGAATEYWFEYGTTTGYGTKTATGSAGSGTSDVAVSKAISGLTSGTEYHYRVAAKNVSGTYYGEDRTVIPGLAPQYREFFGTKRQGPAGIAVDSSNDIWVVSNYENGLEHWRPTFPSEPGFGGEFLSSFGEKGSGSGQLKTPSAVALDKSGNLWVADTGNNRIEKFTPSGEFLLAFGSEGSGKGQFHSPEGVAVDSFGNIWVADTGNARLQEFDSKGTWKLTTNASSHLTEPTAIAVYPAAAGSDVLSVSDVAGNRIVEVSDTPSVGVGIFIRQWGSTGTGNGQFEGPDSVASDSEGNVWVADVGNERVQEFTLAGAYITQVGSTSFGGGRPIGIAVDPNGNIYVSDWSNNAVTRWSR